MDTKQFDTLYLRDEEDEIRVWFITLEVKGRNDITIISTYGLLTGKLRSSKRKVKKGKKDLTPLETAYFLIDSRYKKKLKEGYTKDLKQLEDQADSHEVEEEVSLETLEEPKEEKGISKLAPMTSMSFEDKGYSIRYPVLCQPRYLGVRVLVKRNSQGKAEYFFEDETIDKSVIFSLVKKIKNLIKEVEAVDLVITKDAIYLIDIVHPLKDFKARAVTMNEFAEAIKDIPDFEISPIYQAESPRGVSYLADKMYEKGYSGLMVKNSLSLYVYNHKSIDVQKITFDD